MEKNTHGGAREGAGRKASMSGSTKPLCVRISDEAAKILDGVANKSAYINNLILAAGSQ